MGLPSWARVGAKVVCISTFGGRTAPHIPVKGQIYTISGLSPDHQWGEMLSLAEFGDERISRSTTRSYQYPVHCFRPLVTLEDDIEAHFAHHLTTSSPQGVDA